MTAVEGGESKAPAIARAAAILRLLGRADRPLPLSAIAQELGIVPSTCLYVLRALVAEELVAFDAGVKRYSLEAGVLTLARKWLKQNQFPGLIQPRLDLLARHFGVTMLGVQIVGLEHVIVLAVSEVGAGFQLSTAVGSRFPALISATGRCIAAFGDRAPATLRSRFDKLRWDDPPPFETWLEQVAETRATGFGIDRGNYIAGVTVAAAPIWQRAGDPSHAIVAIGMAGPLGPERLSALTTAMTAEARSLAHDAD